MQGKMKIWKKLNFPRLRNSARIFERRFGTLLPTSMTQKKNGNCGFRAVLMSMGRPDMFWAESRNLLLAELKKHRFMYGLMFTKKGRSVIEKSLQWEKGPAPYKHWMVMPETGYLIANAYERPVHYLSWNQTMTYLPMFCQPNDNKPIQIAFLADSCHFVAYNSEVGAPVPPVVKGWTVHATEEALGWEKRLGQRTNDFVNLFADVDNVPAFSDYHGRSFAFVSSGFWPFTLTFSCESTCRNFERQRRNRLLNK